MAKALEAETEYIPKSNFYFDKNNPAPKNFSDLQIDAETTVTIKGKIAAIRVDSGGKSFEITTDNVKIAPSGTKPMSTAAGMAKIKGKRTI